MQHKSTDAKCRAIKSVVSLPGKGASSGHFIKMSQLSAAAQLRHATFISHNSSDLNILAIESLLLPLNNIIPILFLLHLLPPLPNPLRKLPHLLPNPMQRVKILPSRPNNPLKPPNLTPSPLKLWLKTNILQAREIEPTIIMPVNVIRGGVHRYQLLDPSLLGRDRALKGNTALLKGSTNSVELSPQTRTQSRTARDPLPHPLIMHIRRMPQEDLQAIDLAVPEPRIEIPTHRFGPSIVGKVVSLPREGFGLRDQAIVLDIRVDDVVAEGFVLSPQSFDLCGLLLVLRALSIELSAESDDGVLEGVRALRDQQGAAGAPAETFHGSMEEEIPLSRSILGGSALRGTRGAAGAIASALDMKRGVRRLGDVSI